jgi:hypothetical protein
MVTCKLSIDAYATSNGLGEAVWISTSRSNKTYECINPVIMSWRVVNCITLKPRGDTSVDEVAPVIGHKELDTYFYCYVDGG